MKVVNLEGSRWNLSTETIKKGDKEVVKHFLRTALTYVDANGKEQQSYSRIEIESSFFKNLKEDSDSLLSIPSISDILKDDTFDLDAYENSNGVKKYRTWRIISCEKLKESANNGILLLGGIPFDYSNKKVEKIIYDSRCSKGNVIAFSQTFSTDEEGKKIVNAVQFAAQLFPGDMIAYHVTVDGVTKVYCFESRLEVNPVSKKQEAKIQLRTRAPYAWKSYLKANGFIK